MNGSLGKLLALAFVGLGLTSPLVAHEGPSLTLAPIYTDHMVLQRDREIPVRGTSLPSATVSVELVGQQSVAVVTADASGNWSAVLPPAMAASDLALVVRSKNEAITLHDVSVGDVFLCSGQSNMEFPLRLATDADNAIAAADRDRLRLFSVPRQSSAEPMADFALPALWQPATPQSARDFSAVCYFMGLSLLQSRQVPIGLIASSWGGSFIEAWLDQEVLEAGDQFKGELELLKQWRHDPSEAERQWQTRMNAYFKGGFGAASKEVIADPSVNWEQWGKEFAGFDGFGTYSTTVKLDENEARNARQISLGLIDDIDETFVNGRSLGTTASWNTPRRYDLPSGLLKPGENTIEIRVLDTGGGGGLYGPGPRSVVLQNGAQIPLDREWHFQPGLPLASAARAPRKPWIPTSGVGTLANGMIAPLGTIPLAGIAWYQGESNASDASVYSKLLPQLIADWRKRFDTRRFVIVQLANFGPLRHRSEQSHWAELREVQRKVAADDPDAGLVVTIDVGDPHDIHPANKRTVGQRVATAMDGANAAPLPQLTRRDDEFNFALAFNEDLELISANMAIGFEACADGKCRFVDARLADERTVILRASPGDDTIRFLWSDSPVTNLFYRNGEPVTPFEIQLLR